MSITFESVETEIRRIVAEDPDHVYLPYDNGAVCKYLERDENNTVIGGDCLFGKAFFNLGCPVEVLEGVENKTCNKTCLTLFVRAGVLASNQQANWALTLQERQDRGEPDLTGRRLPWSECLRIADEKFPLGQS